MRICISVVSYYFSNCIVYRLYAINEIEFETTCTNLFFEDNVFSRAKDLTSC